MKRIYKYTFTLDNKFFMAFPRGAKILKIAKQEGQPRGIYCVWALIDPKEPAIVKRAFAVFGTGHDIDNVDQYEYIDTILDGAYVWHFFEVNER